MNHPIYRVRAFEITLAWPNGADFDPATLHDWPEQVEYLTARARQWELATA